jgi:hypothetical protein
MNILNFMPRPRIICAMALVLLAGVGCDVKQELLNAPDPDIINPGDVNSPEAAEALRVGAVSRLRTFTTGTGSEELWLMSGLLTDEWKSSDTFSQRNETDQRQVQLNNANIQTMLREIYRARTSAREALGALRVYLPDPGSIGQMYFIMGFAELSLAEDFCNGLPLSDASTGVPEYGKSLSNAEVFAIAREHFDSALTAVGSATDDLATHVRNAASIGKARALLDLGGTANLAAAAAAVANVKTDFRQFNTYSLTAGNNGIWSLNVSAKRYTVGDSFDIVSGQVNRITNALPFASAADPRVPVTGSTGGTSSAGKGFDTNTNLVDQTIWGRVDPAPVTSGVDARLIEAEAKLHGATPDFAGMTQILNNLRDTAQVLGGKSSPRMAALAVPTTMDAAIDLFFREKAFWTFSRGQRLGDLRRLMRQYGRTQTQVFPTGVFFKNGNYGSDVNLPITTDELNNPQFKGCTDRNA